MAQHEGPSYLSYFSILWGKHIEWSTMYRIIHVNDFSKTAKTRTEISRDQTKKRVHNSGQYSILNQMFFHSAEYYLNSFTKKDISNNYSVSSSSWSGGGGGRLSLSRWRLTSADIWAATNTLTQCPQLHYFSNVTT